LQGLKSLESRLKTIGVIKESGLKLASQLPIIEPDPINSDKTIKELMDVINTMEKTNLPINLCQSCDKDIGMLFRVYLKKISKPDCSTEIENCIALTSPILLRLKEYFNRPRPHQAAKILGIPFTPFKSDAALYSDYDGHEDNKSYTSSYPGGHAMQSRFIARMLGLKYPELEQDFIKIADIIANTRIALGVHFKSDNDYGKLLAESLFDLIK
jgi:hypothetical protein